MCILGVPVRGITIDQSSIQEHRRRDRKLMAFTGFHDQQPATTCASLTGDRVVEVAMLQPIDNKFFDKSECLGEFALVASEGCGYSRGLIHCVAAPSSLDSETRTSGNV